MKSGKKTSPAFSRLVFQQNEQAVICKKTTAVA